jgi:hypothetical protein
MRSRDSDVCWSLSDLVVPYQEVWLLMSFTPSSVVPSQEAGMSSQRADEHCVLLP